MGRSPSANTGYLLKDLLDIAAFQNTLDSFAKLTGLATAILERDGEILVASGWQRICTAFHRKNKLSARRCLESDTEQAEQLTKAGKYNIYKCKNGLVDVAVPIIIEDVHIGNLFAGQFLFEPPDLDFFAEQARQYGFDRTAYMDALSKVPVLSEDKARQVMAFFSDLTVVIVNSSINKLQLMDLNRNLEKKVLERTAALEEEIKVRQAEKQFSESLIHSLPGLMYVFNQMGELKRWNKNFETVSGLTVAQIREMEPFDFIVEEDRAIIKEAIKKVFREGSATAEARIATVDGRQIPHFFTGYHFKQGEMDYLVGVGLDISDRVRSEREKENLIRKLQHALSEVKQLSGFLPICSSCKKVRDDEGYWNQIDAYIKRHSEVEFSHSLCPDCARKLYPEWDRSESH